MTRLEVDGVPLGFPSGWTVVRFDDQPFHGVGHMPRADVLIERGRQTILLEVKRAVGEPDFAHYARQFVYSVYWLALQRRLVEQLQFWLLLDATTSLSANTLRQAQKVLEAEVFAHGPHGDGWATALKAFVVDQRSAKSLGLLS